MQKLAILIDYENFPCPPEGLNRLFADFSQRGTLAVKRAYADWLKFPSARQLLLANQVDMIELPGATKGKNSADIRLVVDAMEFVFTKPHISTFVVVSGDTDFLPLLSRLREHNKQTIVVSRTKNLHAYLRTHCDEFINGDVYLANASNKSISPAIGKTIAKATCSPIPKPVQPKVLSPTSEQVQQIQELILLVWQCHGFELPLNVSILGSLLKKSNPSLNWKDYGFKALQPLVAHLVTKGFLRIELTNGSRNRIYLVHEPKGLSLTANREITNKEITEFQARSDTRNDDVTEVETELVSLIRDLLQDRMPWEQLREKLTQIRPVLLKDLHSEDAFLKQLQSLDAGGLIDLQYDANQKTYFVSMQQTRRSLPCPSETSPVWTQPELF